MHPSLPSKVAHSLREASREPLLPEAVIQIRRGKASVPSPVLTRWARQKLSMAPWFIEDSQGNLSTPLSPVFGVFALRTVIRGFFIGTSFLPGAGLLLDKRHLTLAVIGYYTAALHLVNSFNALQGRVLITPVAGQPIVESPSDSMAVKLATGGTISSIGSAGYAPPPKGLEALCAILNRNADWVFEGRSRSHSAYWRELRQWVTEAHIVPDWLDRFCRGCVYASMKVDESQYIEEGFEHLVEARHQAIYGGFGMDDWAFDQLINREDVYANVAARANNYKQFAYGILQDVLRGTTDLFTHIERQCPQELEKLLPKICAMIYTPPFDLRKDLPDTIGNEVNQVPSCQLWLSRILAQAT